jgi:hypothetical protein
MMLMLMLMLMMTVGIVVNLLKKQTIGCADEDWPRLLTTWSLSLSLLPHHYNFCDTVIVS